MGTLYKFTYAGAANQAYGVIYFGEDCVTGMDGGGGVFSGSVSITDRARGTVNIHFAQGGELVTGQPISPGNSISIEVDGPADFGNGKPINVTINGSPVEVQFEKISDIPIPAGASTEGSSTLDLSDRL